MPEKKFVQINIEEEALERLKMALPDADHRRRSGTQAIEEAIGVAIASKGAVILDETLRRELASRAGVEVPKDAKAILRAFEAATKVTPETVHVEIDPGIASEIRGQAGDRGFTFQEMSKEIIEQSVVDRYMYSSVEYRGLFFTPSEWKLLCKELGCNGHGPKSGRELVHGVRALASKPLAKQETSV